MERTRLRFESIQHVAGNEELAVLMLADEQRSRVLSIVCDAPVTRQIIMRLRNAERCKNMLPEALVQLLDGQHEMMIYGLHDGQYQVVLSDIEFQHNVRIRLSDAVLLSIVSSFPIYIENTLFLQQSMPFDDDHNSVAIPINTMDMKRLNLVLQHAIDEENYELASKVRDEIKRRTPRDE